MPFATSCCLLLSYNRKAHPATATRRPLIEASVTASFSKDEEEAVGAEPVRDEFVPVEEFEGRVATGRKVEAVDVTSTMMESSADAEEEAITTTSSVDDGAPVMRAVESAVLEEASAAVDVARAMKLGEYVAVPS